MDGHLKCVDSPLKLFQDNTFLLPPSSGGGWRFQPRKENSRKNEQNSPMGKEVLDNNDRVGGTIQLPVRIYSPELFKSIKSSYVQLNISSYYMLHLRRVKICNHKYNINRFKQFVQK